MKTSSNPDKAKIKTKPSDKAKAKAKAKPKTKLKAKMKLPADVGAKHSSASTRPEKNTPADASIKIKDRFSMPAADHALILTLKARAKAAGHRPAKKSELLRAGLRALDRMDPQSLVEALRLLDR